MGKLESPVKQYPGYVIMPDFLNIRQVRMFEDAYFGDPNDAKKVGQKYYLSVEDDAMLPVLIDIVLEWHIKNIPEKPTVETFPASSVDIDHKIGHEFIKWLTSELYKMYAGEKEIPNA